MKTKRLLIICLVSVLVLMAVILVLVMKKPTKPSGQPQSSTYATQPSVPMQTEAPTEDPFLKSNSIAVNFLPENPYSRPGAKLDQINAIVVHYVGNPGTTALQNRDYFAGLADTHERSASSHYVIGLDGEIIQCIPLNEVAYASNNRNADTIAIECCHPSEDGKFSGATYQALVNLCAALCKTYGLEPTKDIIRHYDVTGKECPIYFVKNTDAWETFKFDVHCRMQ